jgi:hypothetical protein
MGKSNKEFIIKRQIGASILYALPKWNFVMDSKHYFKNIKLTKKSLLPKMAIVL